MGFFTRVHGWFREGAEIFLGSMMDIGGLMGWKRI